MAKIAQCQMDLYHNLHKREEYIFQSSIDIGADCEIFGITLYNKENPDNEIKVLQVKEKFGSLNFYVSHMDKTLSNMIDKAEAESWKTCEHCGSKDNVIHTEGWIWTVCKDCLQKSAKKSYGPITFWENKKHYVCDKEGIKEI